jgi:hypothetical protein
MNEIFARIARIVAIAQAMLLAVFALDVWQEHNTMLARAEALFIHLLPSMLIAISLFIAWKHPRRGSFIFTLLGIVYTVNEWGHWRAIGLIAAPLIVCGILFWFASIKPRDKR